MAGWRAHTAPTNASWCPVAPPSRVALMRIARWRDNRSTGHDVLHRRHGCRAGPEKHRSPPAMRQRSFQPKWSQTSTSVSRPTTCAL
eukprot:2345576-Prymnesium_polylepis.1